MKKGLVDKFDINIDLENLFIMVQKKKNFILFFGLNCVSWTVVLFSFSFWYKLNPKLLNCIFYTPPLTFPFFGIETEFQNFSWISLYLQIYICSLYIMDNFLLVQFGHVLNCIICVTNKYIHFYFTVSFITASSGDQDQRLCQIFSYR